MMKNNNGFTLVELLGVIVILAILVAIVAPSVVLIINNSKNANYNIMIENIVTASKSYYEECKYGNLKNSDGTKKTCGDTINITLGELVNLGFLTGTNEEVCDASGNCITKLIIKNPKTEEDISNCNIIINFIKDSSTGKITYKVFGNNDASCPSGELGSTN